MSGGGASTTTGGGGGGTPMLMPMCTSAPRAGAASNLAASAITNDVRLILRPPCVYYRQPAPASPALPSGAPNPEACRQRLVEQPRLLARLERHRLAQLLRARPRRPRLAAAEERRAHLLEEVLLLPRREAARDALPEVPPLGPALHGARMAQLGAEHAP